MTARLQEHTLKSLRVGEAFMIYRCEAPVMMAR